MTMLWTYGYTDVLSLKNGFGGWVSEGYPLVGGEAALDTSFEIFLEDMEAYNTISLENFNAALLEDPLPFILDVRGESELEENGYIEGATVIPVRDLATEESLALLPSLDTQILSYCGSGWRCTIALTALEGMGWDDVKCLKGDSFTGWVDAGYPSVAGVPEAVELDVASPDAFLAAEIGEMLAAVPEGWGVVTVETLAQEMIENPDIMLLDVRRLEEVEANGVIEGAVHIPLEEFIACKAEWPATDSTIVVYCGSGHRSTIAMTILWTYDYVDVRSLKDGFSAWVDAGYGTVPYTAP
jgi:rhodanese-related sulfurtransferase